MKRQLAVVLAGQLFIGVCFGETATFIYKDGRVEFGEFKRSSADSVFIVKTGTGGVRESAAIAKQTLSEVIFDTGEKLNLSLTDYPPGPSPVAVMLPPAAPQTPVHEQAAVVGTVPVPEGAMQAAPAVSRTPVSLFIYGGISALVPGLGQTLAGKPGKGAAVFGTVAASIGGSLLAWHYTTEAYNHLQSNKSADGSYRTADFRQFTFRLHGAEILTGVSAILYLLNIADATADAFTYNRHHSAVKPFVTITSTGATGCALAVVF